MSLEALLVEAQQRGFLGPMPVARHLRHSFDLCEALASALGDFSGRFLDLGSGAGLPGLVFAQRFPRARGVLLDSQRKRCEFLTNALDVLGLAPRCSVACGRAEELARDPAYRSSFDLVVARAFGAPATTAECAVGFLSPGGKLAVSEPPAEPADLPGSTVTSRVDRTAGRWPPDQLTQFGLTGPVVVQHGEASAAVMETSAPADARWPRRVGVPAKRPRWS